MEVLVGSQRVETLAEQNERLEMTLALGSQRNQGLGELACTTRTPTPYLGRDPVVRQVALDVLTTHVALVSEITSDVGKTRKDSRSILNKTFLVDSFSIPPAPPFALLCLGELLASWHFLDPSSATV